MRRAMHIAVRVLAALAVLVAIAALAGFLVVQSGWFHEYVRRSIIATIERATGGAVELGRFSFRGSTLTATVAPLVLHGKEGPGDPPLLRIDSVSVGLRIISLAERKVDLASVRVDKPEVHIAVYADGSTNLPSPGQRLGGNSWAEEMLNLAVRRYEIVDGVAEFDSRKIPLNLRGENLAVRMTYDARTPSYRGDVSSSRLRVLAGGLAPVELGLNAQFSLENSRIVFPALRFTTKESRADLTGTLEDVRAPHGSFTLRAAGNMREVVNMFPIPLQPSGAAQFDGRVAVTFLPNFDFALSGRVNARGLAYARDRVRIQGADVRADVNLGLNRLAVTAIQASALGARFEGSATLARWRQFHLEGTVNGLGVLQAARMVTDRPLPWSGKLDGEVEVDNTIGQSDARAKANLTITPSGSGPSVEGRVEGAYDQSTGDLSLASSYFQTPATRLEASGTLNKRLDVRFRSTNLDDLLPALALTEENAPREFPLTLNNGTATADGTVTGTLDNPRFQGQVTVTNGSIQGHSFDRFTADLSASRQDIAASRFTLSRGATEAAGSLSAGARQGSFEDAAVTAQVNLRNANLGELAKEAGSTIALSGMASATARVSGSVRAPQADVTLDVAMPAAFGEQLDRVRASLRVTPDAVEVSNGDAQDGPGRLQFSGAYRHAASDWTSGEAQLQLAVQNLPVTRVEALARMEPSLEARLGAGIRARGRIVNRQFTLTSAEGNLSAQAVTVAQQSVGNVNLTAQMRGDAVSVEARGMLQEASFDGQGMWTLQGDQPGSATVRFARMSVESVHRLAILAGAAPPADQPGLPFEGFLEGRATLSFPLRRPAEFQAGLTLDTVQLNPKPSQAPRLGVPLQDIVLRNSQPVTVAISSKEARITSARFTARDTSIEATGTVPFSTTAGADLNVRGTVNLIVLQLLNPDLLAKGNASVQASLRGSLRNPNLNGHMELMGASLYLNDYPTGLDNANGAVVFDRNRATIEKLTAEVGGGNLSLTGFLELSTPLSYRLQAEMRQVRLRLPEDLSTTFNADLALTGAPSASTLSGSVTLNRAAFNPRTDIGQLLAASAKPVPAPSSENEYLRGMQFDLRIQSGPSFELQTALTRDVEAEVDLRLRGSPIRPALLGSISVNQGEIQLFGNRYTIDRGDIRFLNPVTIEPNFDVSLETRARGVTVNINLAGTTQKLKVNYSSDPPLQQNEIIALLAVGRAPTENAGLASAQTTGGNSFVEAGGGLLGQAVSQQLSSRLQRFFGATRVKIDPTMTGVDNTPQARLTFEQQVSKDITLTYITNLNYTAEQIVRFEWDFSREWSLVAVRDANGLLGVDFQYRKRFK